MSRHTHPNPKNPPGSAVGAVSSHRKSWRFRVFVAAIIASLPVTGCRRPADKTDAGSDAASIGGAGLNVLLISVDTTRADHLGCYGHPARHTPNIDRLAAEGTRFAQCVASTPVTLPSHATMLTGSYPFVHGVRDNGTFRLESANVTLAEIFRTAGYVTHAEVASTVMDAKYGLDQGFDTYAEVQPQAPPVSDEESDAKLPLIEYMERKADDVTRGGVAFLEQNKDRPFFLFLHYYDRSNSGFSSSMVTPGSTSIRLATWCAGAATTLADPDESTWSWTAPRKTVPPVTTSCRTTRCTLRMIALPVPFRRPGDTISRRVGVPSSCSMSNADGRG